MCLFIQVGQVYPLPPSLSPRRLCFVVFPLCLWWLVVVGGCMRAYLKRFIPAPSSHWGRCTLIRCSGTQDPRIQRWVARTKVIAILILTYPHVFD